MNRAPEPTQFDIDRAAKATAADVFNGSDGALTVAYYRRLCAVGAVGVVAMNLFRASKTSHRAKNYRGRQYRGAAYDVKNYSLTQLCASLTSDHGTFGPISSFGWKHDPNTPGYEWVLYVDVPFGQISFHAATRGEGPDYPGEWDGQRKSQERVLAFCDSLFYPQPDLETFNDKPQ